MTRLDSTGRAAKAKRPGRLREGFPLFRHGSGQWAKKVRGRIVYFGSLRADPDGQKALNRWLDEKDQLLAGRKPRRADPEALTVGGLVNLFLESRERRVKTGELSAQTLADYLPIGKQLVEKLGRSTPVEHLEPADFSELRAHLAEGVNLKTLEGRIASVRAIFNHADKNGWLERPLSRIWGTEFGKPSRTALNKLKAQTVRLFSPEEIWRLLDHAGPQMRAMILLGLNCAYGPTDLARLGKSDIAGGIATLARSKTGQQRRCPIWPETLEAVRLAIEARPEPKDAADADLVFTTKYGRSWRPSESNSPLSSEFAKLAKLAGIVGKGKTFYALRHTFQTVADETKDFVAVSAVMGHAVASISDHYRERIGDDRLRAVVEHVRQWLLAGSPTPGNQRGRKGGAR